MSVVGIFLSAIEKRILVFTSMHGFALVSAHEPLTLDATDSRNRRVRSWNTFGIERVIGERSSHCMRPANTS